MYPSGAERHITWEAEIVDAVIGVHQSSHADYYAQNNIDWSCGTANHAPTPAVPREQPILDRRKGLVAAPRWFSSGRGKSLFWLAIFVPQLIVLLGARGEPIWQLKIIASFNKLIIWWRVSC